MRFFRLRPRHTFREYLELYAEEHTRPATRITHLIGIPMILAAVPSVIIAPPVGAALLIGGLILQDTGHYVFEKNKPAFYADPFHIIIGPIWVALELAQILGLRQPAH
jgi:uncharacterized membrane protein YGL010W